jgi:hypothetical protein
MALFKHSDEEILPDLPSDDVRAAKDRLEQKKASHSQKTIAPKTS